MKTFASDNSSGVHPEILKAIADANDGHELSYGDDKSSKEAEKKFRQHFGDVDVYFVYNGTAANVLGLKASTESFNSVICSACAHMNIHECGAPEKFTGCKLIAIPTSDGKITLEQIKKHLRFGDQHETQPKVISITQPTEYGTLYTIDEIRKIADLAHKNHMYLHVDGARISNAAAALGKNLREITGDVGVDILSFGGTKNGMMFGEAVVFFDKKLSKDFMYIRKQGMQLASKMRFIAAQFIAILSNDLWLRNAQHSNKMAKLLASEVAKCKIKITQKVEANAVFAIVPKTAIAKIQKKFQFYVFDEEIGEVRWMTTFDTTEQDIKDFVAVIKKAVS